jgi:GntR family transcriptional regulator
MSGDRKGGELTFVLDPTGGVPFYRQIILQVEMAIADGRLGAGAKLPTVRGLAVDLQINPNTVARAYNELEIRGVVTTQQGTGTFISEQQIDLSAEERQQILSRLVHSFLGGAASYGFSVDEIAAYLQGLVLGQGDQQGDQHE